MFTDSLAFGRCVGQGISDAFLYSVLVIVSQFFRRGPDKGGMQQGAGGLGAARFWSSIEKYRRPQRKAKKSPSRFLLPKRAKHKHTWTSTQLVHFHCFLFLSTARKWWCHRTPEGGIYNNRPPPRVFLYRETFFLSPKSQSVPAARKRTTREELISATSEDLDVDPADLSVRRQAPTKKKAFPQRGTAENGFGCCRICLVALQTVKKTTKEL